MTSAVTRQAEVRDHYRALAPKYGAQANQTCERTYRRLVQRFMGRCDRVLELGSGSTDLLDGLGRPFAVASDLSADMLLARAPAPRVHRLVAAGERLPFPPASFDGLFSINVLEHVADLDATFRECARVLTDGGLWFAVTPNGNWEFWLDLAERWSLKIPEGPHSFLTTRHLLQKASNWFEVVEHRTFLVLPAGPPGLARLLDSVSCCSTLRWGFFQYLVARKRSRMAPPVPPRPEPAWEVAPKPAAGATP
jgi:ubiquinone/menaquinone biosynthesis C-methylase UbiE